MIAVLRVLTFLLAAAAAPALAQDARKDEAAELLSAVVQVKAKILPDARSLATLGPQRQGSGVLVREGYIRAFSKEDVRPGISELKIELKYQDGQPAIREIHRVSKPGRRVYSGIKDLSPVYNGLGISILSTPRGVMSDAEAREAHVGGEVLCTVF